MVVLLEEAVVDSADGLIPLLTNILLETDEQKEAKDISKRILKLMGRYTPASAFLPISLNVISLKLSDNEDTSIAGLVAFRSILEGYFEALPSGEGLLDKADLVKSLFEKLGSKEYLEQLTKYMITPFSQLFVVILETIVKKALDYDQKTILKQFQPQIVRICLTALSIPIYLLVNDSTVEINFKLIKSSIQNTSKLADDTEAKYYLGVLNRIEKQDSKAIITELSKIPTENIGQGSNDVLITESLLNYALFNKDTEAFSSAISLLEARISGKETFTKTIINLNSYLNFYVKLLLP